MTYINPTLIYTSSPARFLSIVALLFLVFTSTACSNKNKTEITIKEEQVSTLRIGILPAQSKEITIQRFTPFLNYLSKATGQKTELIIPESYEELLKFFGDKKVDLAQFGGFTFVKAYFHFRAQPLAMSKSDQYYSSAFIVRADNHANSISDFKGKKFSFGSQLSTSGHLMPRDHMQKAGITPEEYFEEIKYSGKHDLTAQWVRDSIVDIGSASHAIVQQMFTDGRLNKDEIRIIDQTIPFADRPWAVQQSMDHEQFQKILNAFLALDMQNEEHSKILTTLKATEFTRAYAYHFNDLIQVSGRMGYAGHK